MKYTETGLELGPLMITTFNQASGAPLVDRCWIGAQDGRTYLGRAILLTPWRRDRYGSPVAQRALAIGWKS